MPKLSNDELSVLHSMVHEDLDYMFVDEEIYKFKEQSKLLRSIRKKIDAMLVKRGIESYFEKLYKIERRNEKAKKLIDKTLSQLYPPRPALFSFEVSKNNTIRSMIAKHGFFFLKIPSETNREVILYFVKTRLIKWDGISKIKQTLHADKVYFG